jgi:hypothetical protein
MVPDYKDVIVGGRNFRLTHLDARKSVHLHMRLIGPINEKITNAVGSIDTATIAKLQKALAADSAEKALAELTGAEKATVAGSISNVLGAVASQLSDATLDFVIDSILAKAFCYQGNTPIPAKISDFEGDVVTLYELLWEGLKFNLGPFISGIQKRLAGKAGAETIPPSNQVGI